MDQTNLVSLLGSPKGGTDSDGEGIRTGTAELARLINKSQKTIWNYLQILYLEPETQAMIGPKRVRLSSGQIPYTCASDVAGLYPVHLAEKASVEKLLRADVAPIKDIVRK